MQAKKSLGQNFLKNKRVVKKMLETANFKKDDVILEIGPGKGFLTTEIIKTGKRLIALEKDNNLISFLKKKFSENKNIEIVYGDALKIDYEKLNLKNGRFIIIANLPYYITGKFLSNILSADKQPHQIILILQKEIVERITDSKKSSLLSVAVQIYGSVKKIMSISKKNFSPQPQVDSAVLEIRDISKNNFTDFSEQDFFKFVKTAFANKRKMMLKNLSKKYDKKKLEKIFSDLNISPQTRAEDLQVKDFIEIVKKIK